MGRFNSGCLDDWLSFNTVKLVTVRDRYLGALRLAMMVMIFGYIIGFVVIKDKGYNTNEVPIGAIQTSLKQPDDIEIIPAELPYCSQFPGEKTVDQDWVLKCFVLDENEVLFPPEQTQALFITTRQSDLYQKRDCDNIDAGHCDTQFENDDKKEELKVYAAGIEEYTIRVQHVMQARQFYLDTKEGKYSQSVQTMDGELVDINGKHILPFGFDGLGDIISLGKILEAADVDLDHVIDSQTNIKAKAKEPMRHSGIVILFGIDYKMSNSGHVKYTYTATRVSGAEYKILQNIRINESERILRNRHGVKIVIIFSGLIGRFDFQTLLIQLVSGLGLLTVATVITDFALQYFSDNKEQLVLYKYKKTQRHDTLREKALSGTSTAGLDDTMDGGTDSETADAENVGGGSPASSAAEMQAR